MKVVHLGTGVSPTPPGDEIGGVEEYVYQLSHHLGRLGCQVYVIDIKGGAYQKKKREQSPAKFREVWHLPVRHDYNFPFLRRFINYALLMSRTFFFAFSSSLALIKLIWEEQIEVIQAYIGPPALTAIVVNKLRRNRAAVVFTTQSPILMRKPSWFRRLVDFSEILPLKLADHIITDSPTVKRALVSDFKIDPSKITPMMEGIALDEAEVKQFLSDKTRVSHQSNIVLNIGGVSSRKNQLSVVKAIPQVVAAHPEVKFVFAGPIIEPDYLKSMQRFIAEHNLASHVEVKGEVSRQELYNLYNDAMLFVFPTTAESQGVVMIEAMTFGLPVIASTIEPIKDVVSQKEGCAVLLDPYDVDGIAAAIIRLVEDSSLRQSMSQKAKELAKGFSNEHNAAQLFTLYNELVRNKKAGSRK